MTIRLTSLETELERLARDFATLLIDAAVRAPTSELRECLLDGAGLAGEMRRVVATLLVASEVVAGEALPRTNGASPKRRAVPSRTTRELRGRVPASVRGARFDAPDDGDVSANMITDPSLLLDVIGSDRAPSARATKPELELLTPTVSVIEQGPSLRPGERIQRTASGNVVLRRGGK